METFDKAYFERLAHDIMFDVNEQEVKELQEEFKDLMEQIDVLDEINTDGVEEMIYPFEAETLFLREDEVKNVLTQEEVLGNAASVRAGHVHVPKVVK